MTNSEDRCDVAPPEDAAKIAAALSNSPHVQVLRVSGAGADHPFLGHVPEGRYLKAVFCRVHEAPRLEDTNR